MVFKIHQTTSLKKFVLLYTYICIFDVINYNFKKDKRLMNKKKIISLFDRQ